jgi:tetratricopeptide (TPR) repeat protein
VSAYNHAITDFTEALRLDPNEPQAFFKRAWTNFRNGEFDKAIADYNAAIDLEPSRACAYAIRGMCLGGNPCDRTFGGSNQPLAS